MATFDERWSALDELGAGLWIAPEPSPAEIATARLRRSVRPEDGRRVGMTTRVLDAAGPAIVGNVMAIPRKAFEASEAWRLGGDYDPGPIIDAASLVMTGGLSGVGRATGRIVLGAGPVRGKGSRAEVPLPMDEASRMSRARKMGYSAEPFYRGEASGVLPERYPEGAYFSRDREYAAGFARRGGQSEPREFRLDLRKTFHDGKPLTASEYSRLVDAALKNGEERLASNLSDMLAPGLQPDHLRRIAATSPDMAVTDGGALIRHVIEFNSRSPEKLFEFAGYDAVASGRDVRKLTGAGIRLKDAAFDTSKAKSTNITAGLAALAGIPLIDQLSQFGSTSGSKGSPYFSK